MPILAHNIVKKNTMVQEFHVVRCFSCQAFQSQQVKKVNKFVCKLCGSKQSVRKEYGRGSGKDCRIHVQKLNNLRGEIEVKEEEIVESKLQEGADFHGEYYDQEYEDGEQYECLEIFGDNHQYGNFQHHESDIYEEFSSTVNDYNTNRNDHTKEGRKSKWASYLSNETVDEEDECKEMHEHFNQQEGHELSGSNQLKFNNSSQKSRSIATNSYKRVKRDECHPYKKSTVGLPKRLYNVNTAEINEIFVRKQEESFTKVPVNSSTQANSNFEQNNVGCPSSSSILSERKVPLIPLKEKIQFKKGTARSLVSNSVANVSTNKIGTSFTIASNIKYKEISPPSDATVLAESNLLFSPKIKNKFKQTFMTKVKGTENIYNKFADAHELEDIL